MKGNYHTKMVAKVILYNDPTKLYPTLCQLCDITGNDDPSRFNVALFFGLNMFVFNLNNTQI